MLIWPLKHQTMATSKRAIATSVSVWIVASGYIICSRLHFIQFYFRETQPLSARLPFLSFVYTGIIKRLHERAKYWRGQTRLIIPNLGVNKREKRNKIKNTKKEYKAGNALMIVLLAFLASFTPACVMIYWLNFCSNCSCLMIHWLRDLQVLIVLCNSAINPYLSAWRVPRSKRAFIELLHRDRNSERRHAPRSEY